MPGEKVMRWSGQTVINIGVCCIVVWSVGCATSVESPASNDAGTASEVVFSPDYEFETSPPDVSEDVSDDVSEDVACPDDDSDGVCNEDDLCLIGDDNDDADEDGTPDLCDCDQRRSICDENASCAEQIDGVLCECNEGWDGDGTSCEDIDECLKPDVCASGAHCVNREGDFVCECNHGLTSTDPENIACADIDECDTEEVLCAEHAECLNLWGTYECRCERGYRSSDPATVGCEDVNECVAGDPCADNTDCANTIGGFVCTCQSGYDGRDPYEEDCWNINECEDNPCHEDAWCEDFEGSYACHCEDGFIGSGHVCIPEGCQYLPRILYYTYDSTYRHGAGALDLLGCGYTEATAASFVADVLSAEYGVVVMEMRTLADGPEGDWIGTLDTFLDFGGAAVLSSYFESSDDYVLNLFGAGYAGDLADPPSISPFSNGEEGYSYPIFHRPFPLTNSSGGPITLLPYAGSGGGSYDGTNLTTIDNAEYRGAEFLDDGGGDTIGVYGRFGRAAVNGFVWNHYSDDVNWEGGAFDIEELIANQIAFVARSTAPDLIAMPFDYCTWDETAAELLYRAMRGRSYYEPTYAIVNQCTVYGYAPECPSSPYGRRQSMYDALYDAGFDGSTYGYSDPPYSVFNLYWDVLLIPAADTTGYEPCPTRSEAWGDIIRLLPYRGMRTVITSGDASNTELLNGITVIIDDSTVGLFGSGDGVSVETCTFTYLDIPFFAGFDEINCIEHTDGWRWSGDMVEGAAFGTDGAVEFFFIWRVQDVWHWLRDR